MANRRKKTALIVVDLQNDFVPGGSLAVSEGHEVIELIDQLLQLPFHVKVATKDWHPADHGSFASTHKNKKIGEVISLEGIEQILWPTHCVQGTPGSEFAPGWDSRSVDRIFYKGTERTIDSYSTFFDNGHLRSTGLESFLKEKGITEVYIAGLATDYCVKYSVLDACTLGFKTYVVLDACRGVNLKPEDSDRAIKEMRTAGAEITTTEDVKKKINKTLSRKSE